MSDGRYGLRIAHGAARQLEETLPAQVAAACYQFVVGALLDEPHRVGKPIDPPLAPLWSARRGPYRVIYLVDDADKVVIVTAVRHRSDAYSS